MRVVGMRTKEGFKQARQAAPEQLALLIVDELLHDDDLNRMVLHDS